MGERRSFFPSGFLTERAPQPTLPHCGACGLYRKCKSPKMAVGGQGKKKVLVVGEAPGENEDFRGEQFVGETGRNLTRSLAKVGLDLNKDCWKTNALICRPPDNKITSDKWVEYCRPNLLNTVRTLNPEVIILLGATAVESMLGWLWREGTGGITKWAGWKIPNRRLNTWVCPTFHPSFVWRKDGFSGRDRGALNPVRIALFERQLKDFSSLVGSRPYPNGVPDYKSRVKVVLNDEQAALEVATFRNMGRPVAVDYETTTLKPDGPHAQVVCCALSNGPVTVAFPWGREARVEMRKLMTDRNVLKHAYNCKFEDRWSRREFKEDVGPWGMDSMLATHVLDCRRGITSAKFQAFVRLGIEDYAFAIKPYLASKDGLSNSPNRVKELSIAQLCVYCGQDAAVDWDLVQVHQKELRDVAQ